MNMTRGSFLALVAAALAAPSSTFAQPAYPDRVITLVVPFPPGGSIDLIARLLAREIAAKTGANIVIDNRAGAGGQIGAGSVAIARPDGYTLLFASAGAISVAPAVNSKLKYDPLRDFTYIARVGDLPYVLVVRGDSQIRDIASLRKAATERKGGLNYGSHGVGAFNHLLGALLNGALDGKLTHIPYKGSAPALQALLAGEIDLHFETMPGARPFLASKSIRPLAMSTAKRTTTDPDIPSMTEFGLPQVVGSTWTGVLGPAATPQAVVDWLNREVNAALNTLKVQEQLARLGVEVHSGNPEALARLVRVDVAKWTSVAKANNITAE
jgi:tripartite-type tricarboxylate transporter receptor subunit TctC